MIIKTISEKRVKELMEEKLRPVYKELSRMRDNLSELRIKVIDLEKIKHGKN